MLIRRWVFGCKEKIMNLEQKRKFVKKNKVRGMLKELHIRVSKSEGFENVSYNTIRAHVITGNPVTKDTLSIVEECINVIKDFKGIK
jgi:hypothetical protein